jgi:hypothetical protein
MYKLKAIIFAAALALPVFASAQCTTFLKTRCAPHLKPYISSGQAFNSTLLSEDRAKIVMTFYEGMEYRVVLCSHKDLGNVQLRIKDGKNKVLFTGNVEEKHSWDLKVDVTQVMTIEVITPPAQTADNFDKSGCVSLLIGFKPN